MNGRFAPSRIVRETDNDFCITENMNRVVAVISKLESTHCDFPFSGFHIMLQFDLSSTASVVGSGDPYP